MKLKVFDRILLAVLLIVAIVASFALFGIAAGLIGEDVSTGFLKLFYANTANRLILAGSGLLLLLIAVKLLFCGRGDRQVQHPASALIRQSDIGGTFISLEAIDTMVQKYCSAQTSIKQSVTTISPAENGVTIGVRISVLPDTEIVELTQKLQHSLKEYVESHTGIAVQEIGILVENANAAPDAALRVQ